MSGWFPFPDAARAERVRTDRLTMFVVESGEGPPVVLIHGLGWDSVALASDDVPTGVAVSGHRG